MMKHVMSFHLSALIEYGGMEVREAAQHLIHEKLKDEEGDMGLIAVDQKGSIAMVFNSERMHRSWRTSTGEQGSKIYND
jgi:beta-aspartyl-peptidase (threonine type)